MRGVLCVSVMLTLPLPVSGQEAGQGWLSGYIQPAMLTFESAAKKTETSLVALCAQVEPPRPGADSTKAAEAAQQARLDFKALVLAWSRIEFLRFGPLIEENRYERISFWPDPRNVMLRQIPGVLARYSQGEPVDLSAQSVAVQGLPALEYLLYGNNGLLNPALGNEQVDDARSGGGVQSDVAVGFNDQTVPDLVRGRCDYSVDIARNLVGLGSALSAAWASDGVWGGGFASPATGRDTYRSQQEVLSESIKALSGGLQFAAEVKMGAAVGRPGSTGSSASTSLPGSVLSAEAGRSTFIRVQRLPWWRSGLQTDALVATLQGMGAYYAAGHLALGASGWAGTQWQAELKQAVNLIESDRTGLQGWQAARLVLANAKRVLDEDIASALGVGLGFNALDGD